MIDAGVDSSNCADRRRAHQELAPSRRARSASPRSSQEMKKLIACDTTSASSMKPISWPTRLLVQKQRDHRHDAHHAGVHLGGEAVAAAPMGLDQRGGLRGSRSIFLRRRLTWLSMVRSKPSAARPPVRSSSWSRRQHHAGPLDQNA